MNRRNHNYTQDGTDEVEDLLRQAEDAALLKLSVNAHMAHHSSSDLPPDLAHRFQSLKFGPSTSKSSQNSTTASIVRAELGRDQSSAPIDDDPDDLFARFTALKASLPKPSAASYSSFTVDPVQEESSELVNQVGGDSKLAMEGDFNENHENEVEKIIRWAVDAARLDPSPESDDDGHEGNTNASDSDIDSSKEDEDDDYQMKKEEKKKKKK